MKRKRTNPGKGAFKRCVRAVSARGGAYDPRAVCATAARKKYGAAKLQRMAAAGRRALSNPGELEFDTSKAAQQYKRLVEAEGATGVRISRRGHKHVVRWNPRGPRRPKPKKIPKKVLAAHRRIWGGTIPPGALDALRREFTSSPRSNAGPNSYRKTKKLLGRHGYGMKSSKRRKYVTRAGSSGSRDARLLVKHFRKNSGQRNPVEAAREKYEEFHGRPSEDLIEVDTPMHVHDVLSGIGTLVKLVVLSTNGKWRVNLTKFGGTLVAQNEDSDKMPQLYFEGGDQEVNLEDFGITDPVHEFEELGRMEWIYYHTVKDHLGDDGGDAVYKHKLRRIKGGKRGREKPVVIYDVRNKLLSIAGGAYTILPEGIEN